MGEVLLRNTASGVFGEHPDNDDIETIAISNRSGKEGWRKICSFPQDKRADFLSRNGLLWVLICNYENKNERDALFQEILTDIGRMNPAQKTAILSAEGAIDALSLIAFRKEKEACAQQIRDLIATLDDGQQTKVLSTEGALDALFSVEKMLDKKPSAAVQETAPSPRAMA